MRNTKALFAALFAASLAVPAFAYVMPGLSPAQQQYYNAQQRALQDAIYHHHILPNMQGGGYAPQEPVYYQREWYYTHAPQYVAYAIGAGPATSERHVDGFMRVGFGTAQTDFRQNEGYESREHAHKAALEFCDEPNCRIIAEAGNTCMGVTRGDASTYNLSDRERDAYVAKHGVDGTFYVRYYFAYLEPHERGDAQADVSEEQESQWRHMLRERAYALCQEDGAGNPLHQCEEPDGVLTFSVCAIDEIKAG